MDMDMELRTLQSTQGEHDNFGIRFISHWKNFVAIEPWSKTIRLPFLSYGDVLDGHWINFSTCEY